MATTTTHYGFDIPQSTDLVKDGATAIATLGQDIDTAMNTALGTKKSGLVLLNTTSFSAVSSFSFLANTFTSTYENYKVLIDFVPTNSAAFSLRLRASGTDDTAAQYNNAFFNVRTNNTSGVSAANASATSATLESIVANFKNSVSMDIFSPQLAKYTSGVGVCHMGISASDAKMYFGGFQLSNTTVYDSMSWIIASGTITGSYSVYGYNK
jgi:hypothetical protein